MADGPIIEYGDLIGDDGTFDDLKKNIQELKADLLDLAKAAQKTKQALKPNDTDGIEKLNKEVNDLKKSQKELMKVEKAMQTAKKKTIDLTNEELVQREKQKIAQRERVQIAKQQAILLNKEAGEIEKLRAQLALTTLRWKKITEEQKKNNSVLDKSGRTAKSVIKDKKRLTDQLKKLEKQTGDTRRNVGNYSDSLGKLGKVAARVFVGRTIVDGLRSIANGVVNLIEKNREGNKSIDDLGNAFSRTTGALSNAATQLLTFFAPALTAVADGISFVVGLLFGANSSLKEFSATSDELTETTKKLNEEFAKESAELAIVFTELKATNEGTEERKDAIDKVNAAYGKYLPSLLTENSSLREIAKAQNLANEALTKSFLLKVQEATLADVVTGKVKDQIKSFEDLQKTSGDALKGNISQFNQLIASLNDTGSAASRALISIEGNVFAFNALNDEVRKTDPALADFLQSIKDIQGPTRGVLIDDITRAANTANKFNAAITETNASISDISNSIVTYDHAVTTNTSNITKNTEAQKANREERLKAIEAVQLEVEKAEIANAEDKQERLLALEELRFRAETDLREAQFKEDKVLLQGHEDELAALQDFNDKLAIERLKQHEENKLSIRKKFASETIEIGAISVQQDALDEQEALLNEEVKLVEDANEKKKKSNDDLIKDVQKSAQQVGKIIQDLFEKQADLSEKRVDEQEGNLSRARDRAAKGLKANLVFEEQELAKRQAENNRRQKEAEQAARLLTLFNLVSAYAGSGDKNALARGLVDFSLLTALSAGFEEGGFTGTGGKSDIAGVVHGREYVVTAEDTARFGLTGKTGGEFGEAMSDYFTPQTPVLTNPYQAQKEAFKQGVKQTTGGDTEMVRELKAIKSHLSKQPNIGIMIEEVYENVYVMIKKESKSNLAKISKKFLRAKK